MGTIPPTCSHCTSRSCPESARSAQPTMRCSSKHAASPAAVEPAATAAAEWHGAVANGSMSWIILSLPYRDQVTMLCHTQSYGCFWLCEERSAKKGFATISKLNTCCHRSATAPQSQYERARCDSVTSSPPLLTCQNYALLAARFSSNSKLW